MNRLAFLRYHWLLTTVSSSGHLRYLDVSTGANVSDISTRLGDCDCLRVNPWNALVHLGHRNGVVTMWTPSMSEPAVKMLCHKVHARILSCAHARTAIKCSAITCTLLRPLALPLPQGALAAIAIDRSGRYMATSGRDGALKLWDIRTYRPLHEYRTPRIATSIDISDTGMLAAVHGASVQVFKDCLASRANGPYMTHMLPRCVGESARFCPFEDTLGIGHSTGFCSMLVPGSGEPNFDSYEANPYEGRKQSREGEVISLLEKLPPETILLDPSTINTVERNQTERLKELRAEKDARVAEANARKREKKKTRGRSKIGRRLAKKQSNIIDEKREARKEQLEAQRKEARKRERQRAGPAPGRQEDLFDPLARFGGGANEL